AANTAPRRAAVSSGRSISRLTRQRSSSNGDQAPVSTVDGLPPTRGITTSAAAPVSYWMTQYFVPRRPRRSARGNAVHAAPPFVCDRKSASSLILCPLRTRWKSAPSTVAATCFAGWRSNVGGRDVATALHREESRPQDDRMRRRGAVQAASVHHTSWAAPLRLLGPRRQHDCFAPKGELCSARFGADESSACSWKQECRPAAAADSSAIPSGREESPASGVPATAYVGRAGACCRLRFAAPGRPRGKRFLVRR